MTPLAGVLMLGRGHICHYSEHVIINTQQIYFYCVKGLLYCFSIPLLFFIYSIMGLLICKYGPFSEVLTRSR